MTIGHKEKKLSSNWALNVCLEGETNDFKLGYLSGILSLWKALCCEMAASQKAKFTKLLVKFNYS